MLVFKNKTEAELEKKDSNSKQHKGIVAELGTGQWAHPTTVATIWHCFKGPAIVDSRMTANTAS